MPNAAVALRVDVASKGARRRCQATGTIVSTRTHGNHFRHNPRQINRERAGTYSDRTPFYSVRRGYYFTRAVRVLVNLVLVGFALPSR